MATYGDTPDSSNLYLEPVKKPPNLTLVDGGEPQSLLSVERVKEGTNNPKCFPVRVLVTRNDKYLCGLCEDILRDPVQSQCGHRSE